MKRKIIFTVTTDITYDQRMIRICEVLHENDFEVLLVGRKKKDSLPLNFPFKTDRLHCISEKGKWFYIEYNIRLFFYLLFKTSDIICAIDLDSIVPSFLISKIKNKPLVYDAHEYFTEVIEVTNRPRIKRMWEKIEGWIVPQLKYAYTVNSSIAQLFQQKYGTPFEVIRNIRPLKSFDKPTKNTPYLIYAGALNQGRGLEETIEAIKNVDCQFMICGEGDLSHTLREQVRELKLENKVIFKGYVQPNDLQTYVEGAYAGILVLKNEGLSYYYSLANKFFDYLHAEIPQIVCDFPEYKALNEQYIVAIHASLSPSSIKEALEILLTNEVLYNELVENTKKAKTELNWQKESQKLIQFYNNIL